MTPYEQLQQEPGLQGFFSGEADPVEDQEPVDPVADEADLVGDDSDPDEEVEFAVDLIRQYWANEKDPAKLWASISSKEQEHMEALMRHGLFYMWRLSDATYYGIDDSEYVNTDSWRSQTITFYGENDEHVDLTINEYRSYIEQIVSIITKTRPVFQSLAENNDYTSLAQVEASDNLVRQFLEGAFTELKEREAVVRLLRYGKAYVTLSWDPDSGPWVTVDEQVETPQGVTTQKQRVRSGQFRVSVKYPWEVSCEIYKSEVEDHYWRCEVEKFRNKADMIARYPKFAKEIDTSGFAEIPYDYLWPGADLRMHVSEDACVVRTFYHAKTAALPEGRKVVFCNDVMVDDQELGVDDIPVIAIVTGELVDTCIGTSHLWNTIPSEQIKNQVLSDMATNIEAFGRPPLLMPEGADLDLDELSNGQKLIYVPTGADKPSVMAFPETPQQSFKVYDIARQAMQSVSGINAISRGETSSNVTSGAYAALYSQNTVDNQNGISLLFTLMRERVANSVVDHLQRYATAPQLVAVAGQDQKPFLQYFTKDQWSHIRRVKVEAVNPMLATREGRLQVVDAIKNFPGIPIKDPQQIVELIVSGTWKPLFGSNRISSMRIRYENEKLLNGSTIIEDGDGFETVADVPVYATDDDTAHIFGHLEVLNSPLSMQNPSVRSVCMAHIAEHIRSARTKDPYLAKLMGFAPPEAAMGQGGNAMPPILDSVGQQPSDRTQHQAQNALGEPDDSKAQLPSAPVPSVTPTKLDENRGGHPQGSNN